MKNDFNYKANFVPLSISNSDSNTFRETLNAIPYLLYQVEQLSDGKVIAINKPGGKRNFGRLSRNDFMVFVCNITDDTMFLISHKELENDFDEKFSSDKNYARLIFHGLYCVCCGQEPDTVIKQLNLNDTVGLPVELILKVYKWIWGQEDCNYPTKKGRWLSMDYYIEKYNIDI